MEGYFQIFFSQIPNPLTCSLLCSTSLQVNNSRKRAGNGCFFFIARFSPGAGSTTDDKKEMNERRRASQFMRQNSPRLTLSLYSRKKCFPNVQARIGCKNCHKELVLSNQKTKKEAHIERKLYKQCTSNPNAHCPNATPRLTE